MTQSRGGVDSVPVLVETLVEEVVLPAPGDAQVLRGDPDTGEAMACQDPLRAGVVHQGACLQAVQTELIEGETHHDGNRGRGYTATVVGLAAPVTQMTVLERTANDVADGDSPDDTLVVEDHVRHDFAGVVPRQGSRQVLALVLLGEERVRTRGLPGARKLRFVHSSSARFAASSSFTNRTLMPTSMTLWAPSVAARDADCADQSPIRLRGGVSCTRRWQSRTVLVMATMNISSARENLPGVVELARTEAVFLERYGRPAAVLVSPEQYEKLVAALEDAGDVAAFDAAMDEEGPNIPWAQVKVDLGWT